MSIVAMRAGITKSYYAPLADIPVGEAGAKLMKPRSVFDGKWVSAKCQPNDVRVSWGNRTNKEK